MRIKRIDIHNIASIGDASIDFEGKPLLNSPIFLISGETGAGKSTILDSICLALYGKTPRMTSYTKEEIALFSEKEGKQYSNDNAQLLRRGAGEGWAKLFFEGNDGKDYEAVWTVQRDYKKPDRKLQKPVRSLAAADGTFGENKKAIIDEKILEVVGLDYEQFCRTVMLAQGEFTKFLKSAKSEKSGILEKLTGTGIYSRIGMGIANKYLEKRMAWEEAKREAGNVVLMSEEELNEKRSKLNDAEKEVGNLQNEKKLNSIKLEWIKRNSELSNLKKSAGERIMSLEALMGSPEYRQNIELLADYHTTDNVRRLTEQKQAQEKNLEKKMRLFSKLNDDFEKINNEVAQKLDNYKSQSEKTADLEDGYKKMKVSELNEHIHQLTIEESSCLQISGLIKDFENAEGNLKKIDEEITETAESIAQCKDDYEKMLEPHQEYLRKSENLALRISKLEVSVSEAAKEIRSTLEAGDRCPVCGQMVMNKIDDALFSSILLPLQEEKRKTDRTLNDISAKMLASSKILKSLKDKNEKLVKKQSQHSKAIEKLSHQLFNEYGKRVDLKNLASVKEEVSENLKTLRNALLIARESQKRAELIFTQLSEERKKEKKLKKELDTAMAEKEKENLALTQIVTEKVVLESQIKVLAKEIDDFFSLYPEITPERFELLQNSDKEELKKLEAKISGDSDSLKRERGGLANVELQIELHLKNKPEIAEEDDAGTLAEAATMIEEQLGLRNREIGQLKEQLEKNSQQRSLYEKKIRKEEEAREIKEKWEGLYNLLGDKDGTKFRNIAQSYILRSLLENANNYMRCFTDRYTLTCNTGSLVILVRDSYKPSAPQPASILSGGESFMASLSLALALSNLHGNDTSVDVLFIDEGFGTLSPDSLEKVMATLEKLHHIGGRKVGLISHVPEMKERIPVRIAVQRESPALSRVTVTED